MALLVRSTYESSCRSYILINANMDELTSLVGSFCCFDNLDKSIFSLRSPGIGHVMAQSISGEIFTNDSKCEISKRDRIAV